MSQEDSLFYLIILAVVVCCCCGCCLWCLCCRRRRCEYEHPQTKERCDEKPTHNYRGEREPRFCQEHALKDMVDVTQDQAEPAEAFNKLDEPMESEVVKMELEKLPPPGIAGLAPGLEPSKAEPMKRISPLTESFSGDVQIVPDEVDLTIRDSMFENDEGDEI